MLPAVDPACQFRRLPGSLKIGPRPTDNDLLLYTKTHFAAEEQAMIAHGYPGYEDHKARHEKMTRKVRDLHEQFRQGVLSSPIQITNFLKDWLTRHIMETDRKYGPFLAAN